MSHVAVYKWVRKYTGLMDKYLRTITPQVGDKWHADEVWLKVNGDRKYLFAMMDSETRFWIAQEVADSKFKHDARSLLKMGKDVTKKTPAVFVTDGLPSYHDAFKKEFWTLKKPRTEHIKEIHIRNQVANNNIQERLNGEIRDREMFRGPKKMDTAILDGMKVYYNFAKKHGALDGRTPAEASRIRVDGRNKGKTIIQNASLSAASE